LKEFSISIPAIFFVLGASSPPWLVSSPNRKKHGKQQEVSAYEAFVQLKYDLYKIWRK